MPSIVLPLLLGTAFALQPPGRFHGDEAVARDGEHWLALRVHSNDAALASVTLSVRAVEDPVLDAAGERSGRAVSSANDDSVLMYLRGTRLRAGPVERAQVASGTGGLPYEIRFRTEPFRIDRRCGPGPRDADAAQLQFSCAIALHSPGRSQILAQLVGYRDPGSHHMSLGDDATPQLLFAGDLNRDGKLDLIFDIADHYNKSRPTLFLSSPARPDNLLLEVAHYEAIGC